MKFPGVVTGVRGLLGLSEGAPYEVVAQHEGFEERRYPARKWATTSMRGEGLDPIKSQMFMKLFGYIGGENADQSSLAMTVPVATLRRPAGEAPTEAPTEASGDTYTMSFLVPEARQGDAPDGGDDVTLEDRPAITVLTRQFGGYATDDVVAKEASELAALITAAKVEDVDLTSYYIVGYDPPFKPFNRRNEIWYVRTPAAAGDVTQGES